MTRRDDPDVDPDLSRQRRGPADHGLGVLAVIAAGGAIGAEARYGLTRLFPTHGSGVPWVILAINASGGLLMGVLMGFLSREARPHALIRPFLGVGVLGGFTTFSTYGTDAYRLIDAGRAGAAVAYVALTLISALLAVVAGQQLVERPTR